MESTCGPVGGGVEGGVWAGAGEWPLAGSRAFHAGGLGLLGSAFPALSPAKRGRTRPLRGLGSELGLAFWPAELSSRPRAWSPRVFGECLALWWPQEPPTVGACVKTPRGGALPGHLLTPGSSEGSHQSLSLGGTLTWPLTCPHWHRPTRVQARRCLSSPPAGAQGHPLLWPHLPRFLPALGPASSCRHASGGQL